MYKGGIAQLKSSRRRKPLCSTKIRWNSMDMGIQWKRTTRARDTTNRTEPKKSKHKKCNRHNSRISIYSDTKNDGTVWTTGYSGYGTSGIDAKPSKEFRQVPNLTDVIEISSGSQHNACKKKTEQYGSWD